MYNYSLFEKKVVFDVLVISLICLSHHLNNHMLVTSLISKVNFLIIFDIFFIVPEVVMLILPNTTKPIIIG